MKVISEYSRERLNTRRKAGSKAWLKARDRALSMIEVFSRPGAQRQAASGLPRRPCAAKRGRVAKGLRAIFMAEIGRATGRERECQYGELAGVGGSLKKKTKQREIT